MMCINCGNFYHKSCATRDYADKVKFLDDSRLICCGEDLTSKLHHDTMVQQQEKIRDLGNLLSQMEKKTKIHEEKAKILVEKSETEVAYLKILVTETTDKNEILKENNRLLLERIKSLEQQIQQSASVSLPNSKDVTSH